MKKEDPRDIKIEIPIQNVKEDREKSYKVWNGTSDSYLSKSQMNDVVISEDKITFYCSKWFSELHPWMKVL